MNEARKREYRKEDHDYFQEIKLQLRHMCIIKRRKIHKPMMTLTNEKHVSQKAYLSIAIPMFAFRTFVISKTATIIEQVLEKFVTNTEKTLRTR